MNAAWNANEDELNNNYSHVIKYYICHKVPWLVTLKWGRHHLPVEKKLEQERRQSD